MHIAWSHQHRTWVPVKLRWVDFKVYGTNRIETELVWSGSTMEYGPTRLRSECFPIKGTKVRWIDDN